MLNHPNVISWELALKRRASRGIGAHSTLGSLPARPLLLRVVAPVMALAAFVLLLALTPRGTEPTAQRPWALQLIQVGRQGQQEPLLRVDRGAHQRFLHGGSDAQQAAAGELAVGLLLPRFAPCVPQSVLSAVSLRLQRVSDFAPAERARAALDVAQALAKENTCAWAHGGKVEIDAPPCSTTDELLQQNACAFE